MVDFLIVKLTNIFRSGRQSSARDSNLQSKVKDKKKFTVGYGNDDRSRVEEEEKTHNIKRGPNGRKEDLVHFLMLLSLNASSFLRNVKTK